MLADVHSKNFCIAAICSKQTAKGGVLRFDYINSIAICYNLSKTIIYLICVLNMISMLHDFLSLSYIVLHHFIINLYI